MHDRTRRMICRSGFFALCMVPTLAVFAWSSSRTSASHTAACAAELSHGLGLRVSLAGVSYPRPGIALYSGVELADPETSAALVRLRFLESGGGENLTALVASQPEIDALQLGRLWQVVGDYLRQSPGSQPMIRLAAGEATLDWPDGSQTLTEVLGQVDAKPGSDGEHVAVLSFRLAGIDSPEPVRLRYTRRLKDSHAASKGELPPVNHVELPAVSHVELPAVSHVELPAVSHIELHTGGAAVPCGLLTGPLGIANHLGSRAKFRGSVWATETADGWDGELSGQFSDVDLQAVVTEQFPHRLSGTAEITIQKARFHHGRLEEASGTLAAGPGVIGQSLITAAAKNLHLAGDTSADSGASLIPYDQLALAFVIDASGLTLRGQCDSPSGAILRRGETALLAESGNSSGPVVALLRTLVPQSEVQVPATRESDWLMQRLPVPQIMPPATEPPLGKLRLAP